MTDGWCYKREWNIPGLTFYLFDLYYVGETVLLNFLLLGRNCVFFLSCQG